MFMLYSFFMVATNLALVEKDSFPDSFFYKIPRNFVFDNTSSPYRRFLKYSGLVDLGKCDYLGFGKSLLRCDNKVKIIAARVNVNYQSDSEGRVINITQDSSRKLVKALDNTCFLPSVGLMYNVIIPYLEILAEKNSSDIKKTLNEMQDYAGFLEDRILNKNTLVIGNKEKQMEFILNEGYFDRKDLGSFGYPRRVKEYIVKKNGEFYYAHPIEYQASAVRDLLLKEGHVLSLSRGFREDDDLLGVHVTKSFSKK